MDLDLLADKIAERVVDKLVARGLVMAAPPPTQEPTAMEILDDPGRLRGLVGLVMQTLAAPEGAQAPGGDDRLPRHSERLSAPPRR